MRRVAWIPAIMVVIAIPLLLVGTSVTWAVNDPSLYYRGFVKYGISVYTGISDTDLRQVGADIRHYFNSRDEPLTLRSRISGVEKEIFNQREAQHMRDVKRLVQGVYAATTASGAYLLTTAIGVLLWRRLFIETLARLCLWGSVLTLALVLSIGLAALVGFDSLFLKFHQLSFTNDLWQLDPNTDYLVMMFPEGFWFDATMYVASLAVAGAVLLTGISGVYLLYRRRWPRASHKALPRQLDKRKGRIDS